MEPGASSLAGSPNEGRDQVNVTDPCNDKAPWKAALEDAVVIAGVTFFSTLVATGAVFPPEPQVLYATGLSTGLIALTTWATKRGVKIGVEKVG